MPPMRANSPTDNDFSVLNVPQDDSAFDQLSPDIKGLAKEANSPRGSIILEHLQTQIDNQKKVMFGEPLAKMTNDQIAVQTLASMKLITLLETVINDCEIAIKAVKDANVSDKTV